MESTYRVLYQESTGVPQETLILQSEPTPHPASYEVLLEMIAAPINPADLNYLEGNYGKKATLPAVPGFEGVASVLEIGNEVTSLAVGNRVILPAEIGSWRERLCADANALVKVPNDLDPLQAAMLRVNPPTAYLMLEQFVDLQPGDWVIQNAANSAVGRCVIQIAKARGLKTVNVVRRPELISELKNLGADVVILDSREAFDSIREQTGGAIIRLGLNAVGGDNALGVTAALGRNGVLVTYGAMARKPVKLPAGFLIFKNITATGFWVTRWFEESSSQEKQRVFDALIRLIAEGKLYMPIEKTYPITDFAEAIRHAQREERGGKILFQFQT